MAFVCFAFAVQARRLPSPFGTQWFVLAFRVSVLTIDFVHSSPFPFSPPFSPLRVKLMSAFLNSEEGILFAEMRDRPLDEAPIEPEKGETYEEWKARRARER